MEATFPLSPAHLPPKALMRRKNTHSLEEEHRRRTKLNPKAKG